MAPISMSCQATCCGAGFTSTKFCASAAVAVSSVIQASKCFIGSFSAPGDAVRVGILAYRLCRKMDVEAVRALLKRERRSGTKQRHRSNVARANAGGERVNNRFAIFRPGELDSIERAIFRGESIILRCVGLRFRVVEGASFELGRAFAIQ